MGKTDCIHKLSVFLLLAVLIVLCPVVGYADVFTDKLGRTISIPSHPVRIVSLAPNITETLFALGLNEEIVGVTMFSDYPHAARTKPKVGSYVSLSLEKIVSLDPDLIIGTADGNKKEVVYQLERVGFPVYVINPKNFDDIFEMILDIGTITRKRAEARALVNTLRKRVRAVVALTGDLQKPKVFYQIGIDPVVSVGGDTLHNTLIDMAGGVSITGDVTIKYPHVSIEEIIKEKPEIIIVSSMKRGGNFEKVRNQWMKWKNIPAVKNNRIHIINSDMTDHSSPRIVDGLEELAAIIHPELGK
jgi:iron complex transport system substrate-binding protein